MRPPQGKRLIPSDETSAKTKEKKHHASFLKTNGFKDLLKREKERGVPLKLIWTRRYYRGKRGTNEEDLIPYTLRRM